MQIDCKITLSCLPAPVLYIFARRIPFNIKNHMYYEVFISEFNVYSYDEITIRRL